MLDQTKLKFYRFLSVILLVVMLSMSGVMYVSAHGGDVTLIHACVTSRTGAVRIVGANITCDVKETSLDWGIQGPKGDTGDVGPMGPQEPQGPTGVMYFYQRERPGLDLVPGGGGSTTVWCCTSDMAISGGVYSPSGVYIWRGGVRILNSRQQMEDVIIDEDGQIVLGTSGWQIDVWNESDNYPAEYTAYVMCAHMGP